MKIETDSQFVQNHLWQPKEIAPFTGVVFAGKDVSWLPKNLRLSFAQQISEKLQTKPHTMLQWAPEALLTSMGEKRCALITDPNATELLAFAHVWPYPYDLKFHLNKDARYAFNHAHQVLEAGSWLSFKSGGYGSRVMREVVAAGRQYDPEAMIIAIVERNNKHAQNVLKHLGSEYMGWKSSPVLKDAVGNKAQMDIFDVTHIGR